MKKIFGSLVTRGIFIITSLLLQIVFWLWVFVFLGEYSVIPFTGFMILSLLCIWYLVVQNTYSETKIAWIIVMYSFSFVGVILFLFFSGVRISKKKRKLYNEISNNQQDAFNNMGDNYKALIDDDVQAARQSEYLSKIALAPAQNKTQVQYFKLGEEMHEAMLCELRKAEKFIFMEYFIIEHGKMWGEIEEILIEKAKQGVDVRVIYDDFGCLLTLPMNYSKQLNALGIKCKVFNPFTHVFNANFNNRDHRKICVIDGNTGFTGGINLADEYINHIVKHGHWKDTALMLKGEAVYNLTVMFLSMYATLTDEVEDFTHYKPTKSFETDGVIQPFSDTPLDKNAVGESVYMSMLSRAQNYVYITTPYLIISREMMVSLTRAAQSGIDVRLILPHVPDKKIVQFLSRSYYEELLKAGIKIYEYTPGFIHSKMFISDDNTAVVGTINLDYRSLNLHYECGVWMYNCSVVDIIKQDFLQTQDISTQITLESHTNISKFGLIKFAVLGILRVFAPLL